MRNTTNFTMRLECGATKLSRCEHLSLLRLDAILEVLIVGLIKIRMSWVVTTSRLVRIYLQVNIRLSVLTYRLYFEVFYSAHSGIINQLLIIPTKCTMFVRYIYCISSTCFGVTFTIIRENLRAPYLKPCVVNHGFYTRYVINYKRYNCAYTGGTIFTAVKT